MILILLIVCTLLAVAVFVLFRDKMVNLEKWHAETHKVAATAASDLAQFKAYVETHLHLSTTPSVAAPAAVAAKS